MKQYLTIGKHDLLIKTDKGNQGYIEIYILEELDDMPVEEILVAKIENNSKDTLILKDFSDLTQDMAVSVNEITYR